MSHLHSSIIQIGNFLVQGKQVFFTDFEICVCFSALCVESGAAQERAVVVQHAVEAAGDAGQNSRIGEDCRGLGPPGRRAVLQRIYQR